MPGPVFIVGAARSGTTLLRSMLGSHPELAIPPESHFLGYLSHRYARRRWSNAMISIVAADVAADAHFRAWGIDPGRAAAGVVGSQPQSLAQTLGGFFEAYAALEGKLRWGDKTPHYVFILDDLRELWPDLRVVHVIRDGRDVAASHLALHRDGERWVAPTAAGAAGWWKTAVERGRAAAPALGDHYTEVRYEELVLRPRRTLDRVCDAVGLCHDQTLVDYHARVRLPEEEYFARVRGPLDPLAREWRRELTDAQVAAFEVVAGDMLAECGYPLVGLPTRRRDAMAATLDARAFVSARRLRRGVRRAGHRHAPAASRLWQRTRPAG